MAAVSTLIAGVSAAVGIGSAVTQKKEAKKTRQRQEAELEQQETETREAAALQTRREDTGAEVQLGVEEEDTPRIANAPVRRSGRRTTSPLGGLSGAAQRVGL